MTDERAFTNVVSRNRIGRLVVDVPRRFYDDHRDRDCGTTGEIVKTLSTTYRVSLDWEAFNDLRSDADYYAEVFTTDPQPWLRGLAISAKATLRRLDAAVPKDA